MPGEYDCWDFLRDFYRVELGIDLPAAGVASEDILAVIKEFDGSPIRALFGRITSPMTGDAVEITYGRYPSHCGVYLQQPDGDYIIHNHRHSGVVCDLATRMRANKLTFWRYHG